MRQLFSAPASRDGTVAEPPPPAVVISTLFFYQEEVSEKFLRAILKQVNQFAASGRARVHFVASLNYEHPEFAASVRQLAETLISEPRLRFTCVENHYNQGFGKAHNEAFDAHPSDIFIALNNDLFLHDDNWIRVVVDAFRNPDTAIAGAWQSASCLNQHGHGIPVSNDGREADFLEGSLLAVRSSVARQHGLFSDDLAFFYFEDADLCLRYRAAGFPLTPLDIPHTHLRYASSSLVPAAVVQGVLRWNQPRFFSRWTRYLRTRRLDRRITVSCKTADERVLLASLPSLLMFLEDHSGVTLQLATDSAGWTGLFRHPRITIQPTRQEDSDPDSVYDLSAAPFQHALSMGQAVAALIGVEFRPLVARDFLRQLLKEARPSDFVDGTFPQNCALVDLTCFRPEFEGACPSAEDFLVIMGALKARGFTFVLVWNPALDDSYRVLREQFPESPCLEPSGITALAAVASSSLLVGGDGPLLQLAQLLGRRSFTLFGPTLPTRAIHDWTIGRFFVRHELGCLGCNPRWNEPLMNYCLRRDRACMRNADGSALPRELLAFLDGHPQDLSRALVLEQRIQMNAAERSARGITPPPWAGPLQSGVDKAP